jgi:hypothetical protein
MNRAIIIANMDMGSDDRTGLADVGQFLALSTAGLPLASI